MASLEGERDSVQATDEIIRLLASGAPQAALLWAAPLAELDPALPVHWFLLGYALDKLGHKPQAITALGLAVDRGIATSNLPVAIAACEQLLAAGAENRASRARLAQTFAKDSKSVQMHADGPPSLPGQRSHVTPLAENTPEAQVLQLVNTVMERASELPDAPGVSPQPLFSSLGAEALAALIAVFKLSLVPAQELVIQQGTPGEEAFVLARGELEVVRESDAEGVVLARLGNGAVFGEMALLSRAPRAASVMASRPCIVLSATRAELDSLSAEEPEVAQALAQFCRQRMIDNLLRTSRILRAVGAEERARLIQEFQTQAYEPGHRLIAQGQKTDGLYLIASGAVEVVLREESGETLIATLGPGDVVGEVALVLRRPATTDVMVSHPTIVLHLPSERFLDLMKSHPQLLAELYELAVLRDEETSSIVADPGSNADDCILV